MYQIQYNVYILEYVSAVVLSQDAHQNCFFLRLYRVYNALIELRPNPEIYMLYC